MRQPTRARRICWRMWSLAFLVQRCTDVLTPSHSSTTASYHHRFYGRRSLSSPPLLASRVPQLAANQRPGTDCAVLCIGLGESRSRFLSFCPSLCVHRTFPPQLLSALISFACDEKFRAQRRWHRGDSECVARFAQSTTCEAVLALIHPLVCVTASRMPWDCLCMLVCTTKCNYARECD